MAEHVQKDKLIEKMFNAALKEKFSQFSRKYDPQIVFEVWAEVMATRGDSGHLSQWEWNPQMKIIEALEYLDCCCNAIETLIQKRVIKRKQEEGIIS